MSERSREDFRPEDIPLGEEHDFGFNFDESDEENEEFNEFDEKTEKTELTPEQRLAEIYKTFIFIPTENIPKIRKHKKKSVFNKTPNEISKERYNLEIEELNTLENEEEKHRYLDGLEKNILEREMMRRDILNDLNKDIIKIKKRIEEAYTKKEKREEKNNLEEIEKATAPYRRTDAISEYELKKRYIGIITKECLQNNEGYLTPEIIDTLQFRIIKDTTTHQDNIVLYFGDYPTTISHSIETIKDVYKDDAFHQYLKDCYDELLNKYGSEDITEKTKKHLVNKLSERNDIDFDYIFIEAEKEKLEKELEEESEKEKLEKQQRLDEETNRIKDIQEVKFEAAKKSEERRLKKVADST